MTDTKPQCAASVPWAERPEAVPRLSAAQMVAVDRAMVEDYGIALVQMMENAGRCLAHLARVRFLDGSAAGRRVQVLAGTGGNGGGALACARRLANWGAHVRVGLAAPADAYQGVPRQQLAIVERLGLPLDTAPLPAGEPAADLIVDGLIGYSLSGAPRGVAARWIGWTHGAAAPVLALDVPSGVDAGSGEVFDPAIRAAATLTLALPKTGLFAPAAAVHVGELYLADIGVPPRLYAERLGLDPGTLFARGEIVRLR